MDARLYESAKRQRRLCPTSKVAACVGNCIAFLSFFKNIHRLRLLGQVDGLS